MKGKITDVEFTPYPKYEGKFTEPALPYPPNVLPLTGDCTLLEHVPVDGEWHNFCFTRKDGVETYFLDGVELKSAYQPIITWRERYERDE